MFYYTKKHPNQILEPFRIDLTGAQITRALMELFFGFLNSIRSHVNFNFVEHRFNQFQMVLKFGLDILPYSRKLLDPVGQEIKIFPK